MTGPHQSPREDWPTRADLDHWTDPRDGMKQCPYGCSTWFHGLDTAAARGHLAGHESERGAA